MLSTSRIETETGCYIAVLFKRDDPQGITLKSIIVTSHREITTAAMRLITVKQSVVDEKENIKHMALDKQRIKK